MSSDRHERARRAERLAKMFARWEAEDVSGEPEWDVHQIERSGDPHGLLGMMADEPDVMDEVCEAVMQARARSRMRTGDG